MAGELQDSIKKVAARVVEYVDDVATMTVKTTYVEVLPGGGGEKPRLAASTVIKLDGDCEATVPMQQTKTGEFDVDKTLLAIHQNHVHTAIEYRSKMINALLSILQTRTR